MIVVELDKITQQGFTGLFSLIYRHVTEWKYLFVQIDPSRFRMEDINTRIVDGKFQQSSSII